MLISVIIPLFNKGPHIKRAIESVLTQSFRDFEIIVIDDGSDDDGALIVKSVKTDNLKLIQQGNEGVSAARNRGVDEARGELIAFLDADDRWSPEYLANMVQLYKEYPNAGLYSSNYFIVEPDCDPVPARIKGIPDDFTRGVLPDYFKMIALGNNPCWTSAVLVPRKIFIEFNKFNIHSRIYEDLELWSKIALKHDLVFTRECLAYYHKDASNRICRELVPNENDLPFREILSGGHGDKQNASDKYIQQFIGRYALLNAFKCVVNGKTTQARNICRSVHVNHALLPRKIFIMLLSYLPQFMISFIWNTGIRLKKVNK